MTDKKSLESRIACLKREIDNCPSWGAAVSAMGEELRNLERQLEHINQGVFK